MKKAFILLLSVLSTFCNHLTEGQKGNIPEIPLQNMQDVLVDVAELRIEMAYYITFRYIKMKDNKNQNSSDTSNCVGTRTLMMSSQAFSSYRYEQKIRVDPDRGWFEFNGQKVNCDIEITNKQIYSQFYWVKHDGSQIELREIQYEEILDQLASAKRDIFKVPFFGSERVYVLDKSLDKMMYTSRDILKKCTFIIRFDGLFENGGTSATLPPPTMHEFSVDAPPEMCDSDIQDWDSKYCSGTIDFTGDVISISEEGDWIGQMNDRPVTRLFTITGLMSKWTGKVVKKTLVEDKNFLLVRVEKGRELIIPAQTNKNEKKEEYVKMEE